MAVYKQLVYGVRRRVERTPNTAYYANGRVPYRTGDDVEIIRRERERWSETEAEGKE